MKGFLKSKTMWAAYLTTAAGVIQQVSPFIPPEYVGGILTVIGAVVGVLRTRTTQPLSEK